MLEDTGLAAAEILFGLTKQVVDHRCYRWYPATQIYKSNIQYC